MDEFEPVRIPIDGTLDLHTFSPKEVKSLVPEYLRACREEGIVEVRIIHGKGSGTLRRTVHAILDKLSMVEGYQLATRESGNWGATVVFLKARA